jgi:hypothetical protein
MPGVAVAVERGGEPEYYVRVNIEQTAKSFRYETTVSLTGVMSQEAFEKTLEGLNSLAGRAARKEIQNRELSEDAYRQGGKIGALVTGDVSATTLAQVAAEVSDPGWQAPPMAEGLGPEEESASFLDPPMPFQLLDDIPF